VKFDFYIQGKAYSTIIEEYFTTKADIIEGLGVKLLIGTNFIVYNRVKIDLTTITYYFRSIYNIRVRALAVYTRVI
ncbi:hypothetical protein C8A01DRAFT_21081, partial [Parachaetomium inaequale]